MKLDDPALVAREYADDARLRKRASAYTGVETGIDAREPAMVEIRALSPRRVLEVGCGWGELAEWIARDTGAEVVAVDLSPRMVELARERGVDARVADVQELPFADGEFDLVVAAWMLYHVPDLDRGLGELARVLRPGGRLVAVTNSRFHLIELRELVGSGPSTLSFARETGEGLLAPHFARIRREDVDGTLTFADRAAVEAYVRASIAMSPFVENLPAAIDEPFVARRANSIFVAEKDSLMPIDDPVEVKEQYAREDNLRARQALWQGATGTDPKEVLWRTIDEWQPKRLLEVGGGQGELAERIQSELGANVTFLDLSPRMVELAQARGIDARQGDAQELPFADGTFDTVVAAWMLYHVPDVDRALAEFARVLVPGGALIAVTNSADHIAELRELVQHRESWSSHVQPRERRAFPPAAFHVDRAV